jgi:hypothetical protein
MTVCSTAGMADLKVAEYCKYLINGKKYKIFSYSHAGTDDN